MPRWRRFVWQGAAVLAVAAVASAIGDGRLALVVAIVGGVLLVVGLLAGAIRD